MSNIDKLALRTAAENATPGEWCTDDYHGVIADAGLNANYYIASCSGPDNRHNKRFIAAAHPATVLALLDELEAKDQRLNEILKPNMLLPVIDDMDADNLRQVIKTASENYSLLHAKWEAEEKRIAELEALSRTVKQFSEFQICHYGATEDYAKGYIDCQNNYNKLLFAAAGKGEAL